MPRNNDGTFSKEYDWKVEDETDQIFSGEKLEIDTLDLAKGIEESLDTKGRNQMEATLNMNNNSIINLGTEANSVTSVASIASVVELINGVEMVEVPEKSSPESLILYLKPKNLTGLTLQDIKKNRFKIKFTSSFTATPEIIKALGKTTEYPLGRREIIEIELEDGVHSFPTHRYAPYRSDGTETDYVGDLVEPDPTFYENIEYVYQYSEMFGTFLDETYFSNVDTMIFNRAYEETDTTSFIMGLERVVRSGWRDSGYGTTTGSRTYQYNYLAGYDPHKNSEDATQRVRNYGNYNAMLPTHSHLYTGAVNDTVGSGSSESSAVPLQNMNTVNTTPTNTAISTGNELRPNTKVVRILEKMQYSISKSQQIDLENIAWYEASKYYSLKETKDGSKIVTRKEA